MALTAADLLALVNRETGRSETDLTQFLRDTIHDMEADSIFLEADATFSLTTGDDTYPLSSTTLTPATPALSIFRRPFHLQPRNSSSMLFDELVEVSKNELQDLRTYNSSNGRPEVFCVWNDIIELWRPPSSTYTSMRIWAYLNHLDDVTSISYPEKFRRMLVAGCAWYVFLRYGLGETDKAKIQKATFDEQLRLQNSRKANERPRFSKYND